MPLHRGGTVCAVLDIDSPVTGRFTAEDAAGLAALAAAMEEILG